MKMITCNTCSNPVPEAAFFCPTCASQVKCKSCNEPLLKNAKACISCGAFAFNGDSRLSQDSSMNTIKFRETKDERSYEVAFTNDVGKEVSELVANMVKNNFKQHALPLREHETKNLLEDSEDIETNKSIVIKPEISDNGESQVPPLNDVEITFECSEPEWIAIYAFYLSHKGLNTFSREAVYDSYKAKRYTEARRKNFSANWKSLFNEHITTVKENEFRFKPGGIKLVVNLLTGVEEQKPSTKGKVKNKTSNGPQKTSHGKGTSSKVVPKSIPLEEFDAFNKKKTLDTFFKEKDPGKNTGYRILLIAYYIIKINESGHFTEGNIDYGYRLLNLSPRPNFLHQVIINLANRKVWFEQADIEGRSVWKLSRAGETFVEDKLPIKK